MPVIVANFLSSGMGWYRHLSNGVFTTICYLGKMKFHKYGNFQIAIALVTNVVYKWTAFAETGQLDADCAPLVLILR